MIPALLLTLAPQALAQPEVPYVVLPMERPWESAVFREIAIPSRPATAVAADNVKRLTAKAAGLTRLERGSVLLFHSPARKALADEIAALMDKQHRLLYYFTGREFQALSVAVIGTEENLPEPFGFWVILDGTAAWSLRTEDTALPLRAGDGFWAKAGMSWLYHGMLHECCHHGTCYDARIMNQRWFCEGLSDYLGALAAVCYSGDGDRAHVSEWIPVVRAILAERETVDVLADETWFAPAGGRARNELEKAAYGASQYVIAGIVHRRGFDWISKIFNSFAAEPPPDRAAFLSRVEQYTGEKQLAERLAAVPLHEVLAYLERGVAAGR